MKVLSLKEPFATLIKNEKKLVETRSWKTNYRGELYIHASVTKIDKETRNRKELFDLLENESFNFGMIICKCRLVDCIYMTKEYVEEMKMNHYQEYLCGEYKEGRYAWILEDVEPLKKPIKAKGQLGIWNYYTEFDVMELMSDIEYGWLDKYSHKHMTVDDTYSHNYLLQTPGEVIKNKIGVCWDQVELERYYFKGYDIKTYFLVYYDENKCPTHTFLTFKKKNKYCWFEHSWEKYKGIHEYDTLKELLIDVKSKFIGTELHGDYVSDNLVIREYSKPKSHISVKEFYQHCEKENVVLLDSLENE